MKIDHVYCINLESSTERKQSMEKQFESVGLDVEFFKACDGKSIGKNGKFGCSQSHFWIYKDIIEKGYTNALIFEDDVKLSSNFKEEIDNLPEPPENWDLLYLIKYTPIKESTEGVFIKGKCLSTAGYIISKAGCSKIHNFDPDDISYIDIFLAHQPLKTYYTDKNFGTCELPGGLNSTIGRNYDIDCYLYFVRWIVGIFKTVFESIIKFLTSL